MLTLEELSKLAACKSEPEWNAICDEVKKVRGGMYPRDWFQRVQVSGLAARVVASWGK